MTPDDLHDDLIARIAERAMAADAPTVRPGVTNALWERIKATGWRAASSARAIPRPSEASDNALLIAFAAGDGAAGDVLVKRYLGKLVGYARRWVPEAEAEDLAQDTFIVLIRKAPTMRPDSNVAAYLFAVLRKKLIKRASKRAPVPFEDIETVRGVDDPLARPVDTGERMDIIDAMERECTPLEQEVLILGHAGFSNIDVAAQLDLTASHVGVIRHRAIQKLRAALRESEP